MLFVHAPTLYVQNSVGNQQQLFTETQTTCTQNGKEKVNASKLLTQKIFLKFFKSADLSRGPHTV